MIHIVLKYMSNVRIKQLFAVISVRSKEYCAAEISSEVSMLVSYLWSMLSELPG